MHTYSFMNLGGRLAADGEELVAHRFSSGSIGMLSRPDYESWRRTLERSTLNEASTTNEAHHFARSVKNLAAEVLSFYGFRREALPLNGEPGPVVEIPAEALLRVFGISSDWQQQYRFSSFEDALFFEGSPHSSCRRDSLCFGNGLTIPLQFLHEGQLIKVLRHSWTESLESELVHVRPSQEEAT